ncbi:hypothetical protein ASU31_17100 [Pedobacter ginsenosidimutans]|uniref:chitinase n=1 Tax=Pedobacter ginsenosidimutans TaxID=687842 RepID=A0A0T5VMG3_9SPHI|nr:glycosyl hydrolase family 18 protein [Pedobacter ginsenosidimutans]KRT15030.1 hypothetical protein ASU31_17100 [Pedobacter ginsenosidimutans]
MYRSFFYIRLIVLLTVLFSSQGLSAKFKVVGYLRSNNNLLNDVKSIDLNKLTHLFIAFINPEPNGEFKEYDQLKAVVDLAHRSQVKVMISCGGGSRHLFLDTLLAIKNRTRVVNNFIAFAEQYNLDGIDVDIENDDISADYEPFVMALSVELHQKNKEISAALAFSTRKRITDPSLNAFDFVTLMAYDKHAPWRPNDPGQHSPISMAKEQIDYWTNERGLNRQKVIIGVPFYGYGFGSLPDNDKKYREMAFKDIVANFKDAENVDEVQLPGGGGVVYCNGSETIRKKTLLALKETGGIMIWQLMHDASGDHSLLGVINKTLLTQRNKL